MLYYGQVLKLSETNGRLFGERKVQQEQHWGLEYEQQQKTFYFFTFIFRMDY